MVARIATLESTLLGETPIVNVPLNAGEHTIRFENPDATTLTKKVFIKAGQEQKLKVELDAR